MTGVPSRQWLLVLLLVAPALTTTASSSAESSQALFEQLLKESGLRFEPPPDFTDIEPAANPVLHYERALKHVSGELEIRFVIRPLARISIDYNDPHNAAPEPNHLFPLLFESLTAQMSNGGNTPNTEYQQSQARELFNANWAAAAVFDVDPQFSASYSQALLIGIHKNEQADAYSVFLFNEYARAKDIIQGALSTLSFAP